MKPYTVAILLVLILGPIVALGSVPCHVILVHCIWQNVFGTLLNLAFSCNCQLFCQTAMHGSFLNEFPDDAYLCK